MPVPEKGFTDSLTLNLGGRQIFCWFPGAAHSMDNIVVWIDSEKIAGLHGQEYGCRNFGNVADGDLKEYPATIERIIKRFSSADVVIPGHGAFGGIELLNHTQSLAGK